MKLSFRKPLTLLVAAAAFVACSPDSSDSPVSPPLGSAITNANGIVVEVCKVPIREDDVTIDLDAAGEYDFTYEIDGGGEVNFSQVAVEEFPTVPNNGLTDCVTTTYKIQVPMDADELVITELTEQFGDGYAELWRIALGGSQECQALATTDLVNDGTTAGSITFDFTAGDCGQSIKVFFKNRFIPDEGGLEGCTPGAWRNQDGTGQNGKNRWIGTGYDLTTTFESVFGDVLGPEYDGLTLREALDFNDNSGGEALLKHAAAAVLNAAHPDVDYPYSVGEVVSMFQSAWADLEGDDNETKDMFDEANNLGCPI